jgi:cell wall-associated NlpC family hydrolase
LLSPSMGARAFIPVALAGAILLGLAPSTPVAAAGPKTEAQQIIKIAMQQRGDPWRYGATGPRAFDCSGLVIYAFRTAGDTAAVANGRHRSARALYNWYRSRGLASRSNPKPGDLVIWGGGTHVGIYIGGGRAISTLTNGVRVHGVTAVRARFTTYLHTGMWKKSTGGGTVAPASSTTGASHRHTVRAINLRKGPSVHTARIGVLARGMRLTVIASRHDSAGRTWIKVKAGSRSGWVAAWLTR